MNSFLPISCTVPCSNYYQGGGGEVIIIRYGIKLTCRVCIYDSISLIAGCSLFAIHTQLISIRRVKIIKVEDFSFQFTNY